jgi:hypothetical protein
MAPRREKDIEAQMFAGCTAFVAGSVTVFFLSIWPFFVWTSLWQGETLLRCAAIGFVPGAVVGFFSARTGGVAGATGYVAAAMASAVFFYLRLDQIRLSALAQQSPEPDYAPALLAWFPIAWVLAACLVAVASLKPSSKK